MSDLDLWVKILLTVVVIALSPLDIIGAGGVPVAPDKTLIALGAIWGLSILDPDD